MIYYGVQAVFFLIMYWLSYYLGTMACRLVNHMLKRPLRLTPHMAGIVLVYALALVYVLILSWVTFVPGEQGSGRLLAILHSIPALLELSAQFGVALLPCVVFLLLLNLLKARSGKAA